MSQPTEEQPLISTPPFRGHSEEPSAAPSAATESRLGTLASRVAVVVVAVIWLFALPFLTARMAIAYPVSSDDATGPLEAHAILRGNVLLRGWTLSSASFALTDLPFYVASAAVLGHRPAILRGVPTAIYSVTVAAAVLLARGSRRAGSRPALGAAAALVLLGIPAGGLAEFATKGYTRVGTTLGLFGALLALDVAPGWRVSALRIALFGSLLTMTFLSDPYAAYVAGPALLLVSVLGAAQVRTYEQARLGWIAAAVILALLAGEGVTALIERAGGYRLSAHGVGEFLPKRGLFAGVIQSAGALLTYLPDLYRCELSNLATGKPLVLWIGCTIGPALVLFGLVAGCPIRGRRRADGPASTADFVTDVLWILTVLAVVGFLTSDTYKNRFTMRYMLPPVLSGAVLSGRVLADHMRSRWVPIGAICLLALGYTVTVLDDLRKPTAPDPAVILAKALHRHGLRYGYGPYWNASVVTASSDGLVAVRPIRVRGLSSQSHVIEPFRFMADDHWYSEGPTNFVVYDLGSNAPNQFGVEGDNCVLAFGPAQKRYRIGQYELLIWNHDLRPLLNRASLPDPRLVR
jgi:hypothetical protein